MACSYRGNGPSGPVSKATLSGRDGTLSTTAQAILFILLWIPGQVLYLTTGPAVATALLIWLEKLD